MDALSGETLKSVALVDNFLDIDEALQSYLVSLNERASSTGDHMHRQEPAQRRDYPNQYDMNVPSNPTYIHHQQYGVSPETGYYQGAPASTQSGIGIMETKIVPVTAYETSGGGGSARQRASSGRTTASGRNGASKTDLKHSQVQEKNRMAQKRFRERQKAKIYELHQQISTLEQRVEKLVAENSTLQSHNSLLEKVLAMRDEHIQLVQQEQAAEAEQAEKEIEAGCRRLSLNLTAIKGKEVKLSTDNLKKMTPEGVMQIWHTYVTEISSALVEYNSQPNNSTNRLEELISEISKVFMRLSVMNPMLCKVWQAREYHASEHEELKRWQSTLGQLNLSQSQKMEMVQLRRLYLGQLQGTVEEKKKLQSTIHTMLVTQTVSHKLAMEYLKTNQTVMRLRDILRVEHNAMLQFASTVIHKILRPEQTATLIVHAYPQKPDLLAVTSAVAMEIGENVKLTADDPSPDLPTLPDVLSTTASTAQMPNPVESILSMNTSQSVGDAE